MQMKALAKIKEGGTYKKLKNFGKNAENKELVKHSFLALVIRIFGAGAAFLMNVVVARYIGAEQAGYFFLAVSITTLVASIGRVGADQTVLRFVSIHAEKKEWPNVHAVMKKMMMWTYLPLIFFTVVMCVFAKQISVYLFHKEELTWPLFWTSLTIPFFAGYNVLGMALQAVRKVVYSVINLKVLTPLFLIIIAFVLAPKSGNSVSVYYSVACVINLIFGYWWWNKSVPKASTSAEYDTKTLWSSSGPLWVSSIMQQITIWGGQLVAGRFVDSKDVAVLAVARQTTVLVSFILLAVNNVSSPRIAAMYNQGQMGKLKNYSRNSTLMMTIIALPITLFIWFFPNFIFSFFGKDFTGDNSVWILRILTLGQFVSVVSGIVGTLLVMCGYEKDLKNIRIWNGVVAIVLALILTPLYGAIGSALSSAIAMAYFNLSCVSVVKKRLGFSTISIFRSKEKADKKITS